MCFPLNCCYRLSPRAKVSLQKIIERKAVVFARAPENKEQQHEARDNVAAEIVKRVVQKMAEGDDDQDAAERDQRVTCTQAEDDERAGDEFDEWNGDADCPERPDRQECVGERQKIFSRVLERAELKYFHHSGHEEDEAENQAGEEQCPSAIEIRFHTSGNGQ